MATVLKTTTATYIVSDTVEDIDSLVHSSSSARFIVVHDDERSVGIRINTRHIVSYATQVDVHRDPVVEIKQLTVPQKS